MKKTLKRALLRILPVLIVVLFTNCDREVIDPGEMTFVGSGECQTCHSEKYNDWVKSGHPYKFTLVENGVAPTYPAEAVNFQSEWLTGLGDGSHSWDDIAGVIGGYGWKARFVGTDGHIIGSGGSEFSTGLGHNQINFFGGENHGWVNYEVDKMEKVYNYSCFKCHTTGGTQEGSWLSGVDSLGTFTEGGIGCESCHGPGSQHIDDPTKMNIDRVYEFAHTDNSSGGLTINGTVITPNTDGNDVNFLCGTCHNRGYDNSIDASGGFIKHHEQWDEFVVTGHYSDGMTCNTCHDPHKRAIWDGDGIKASCTDCHTEIQTTNHGPSASCVDCHMPYAAKSGTKIGESGFRGDVRSHLMKIIPDTESMFVEDGSSVRDDAGRPAALSPGYSCLGCHNDESDTKTLAEAAEGAAGMHTTK